MGLSFWELPILVGGLMLGQVIKSLHPKPLPKPKRHNNSNFGRCPEDDI